MRLQLAIILAGSLCLPGLGVSANRSLAHRPRYPIVLHERVGCLQKIRNSGFVALRVLRRTDDDLLQLNLERWGMRAKLELTRDELLLFIDQYLATHERFLNVEREFHHPRSPTRILIEHMLETLRTGTPSAPTAMMRTFLRLFYPDIALRGYPPPPGDSARWLVSPLDRLHWIFEGLDPTEHDRAAVFVEALMTDRQLDRLHNGKPAGPSEARNWLRVKLAMPTP